MKWQSISGVYGRRIFRWGFKSPPHHHYINIVLIFKTTSTMTKSIICKFINKYIAEDGNEFKEHEIVPALLTVITITAVLILMCAIL